MSLFENVNKIRDLVYDIEKRQKELQEKILELKHIIGYSEITGVVVDVPK